MGIISNKAVLVTGGAGFIGSNIIDKLLGQNNRVVCLDNFATGKRENLAAQLNNPDFSLIEGDIRDLATCEKAVEGIDIVLHQAALGSVPRSINDPLTTNEVNITGFLNILHASKEAGVKRFVYAASSSTYGDSRILPKVEEQIGSPLSPYAVTKYVNELYAKVYGDLFGMEIIGLRYFNVFGKRQTPNGAYAAAIPRFVEAFIKHHSPTIHGDGLQTRDFTYIENVVQINHLAATIQSKEALNKVYNVAYGERTTLIDLIETIRKALVPFDADIADVPLTFGPSREGDVRDSLADLSKARKLLGYAPTHSLKAGIKEAMEWYWESLK